MPARSLIGNIEEAVRGFYATVLRGEVSDANVRGYLRAATQIEDLWQQIDDKLARLIAGGMLPWDAYAQLRYPLAYIRAARTYQVFVKELLAADMNHDPATHGYLPHITYDQANALCHQIQPHLEEAVVALNDPTYAPTNHLPLSLAPRLSVEEGKCPITHLQGMLHAACEVRAWAAGLIAQYEQAMMHAEVPAPAVITNHIAVLYARLAEADERLRFGTDLAGQISQGEATDELHEDSEDKLWGALEDFFVLNQVVATPGWLDTEVTLLQPAKRKVYRDKRIKPAELWQIAAPSARSELRRTVFGRQEMKELCAKMGGVLSAAAQCYHDETAAALERGEIIAVAAMADCPYESIYRARVSIEIAGAQIPAHFEFHWNYHRGHVESAKRFKRVDAWRECNE